MNMNQQIQPADDAQGRPLPLRTPGARPVADREVPLPTGASSLLSLAVHAWLDGDLAESDVRRGELQRDIEFWKHIDQDAERLRRLRTPTHVEAKIMQAITLEAPTEPPISRWEKGIVAKPLALILVAIGLVAATAGVTAAAIR